MGKRVTRRRNKDGSITTTTSYSRKNIFGTRVTDTYVSKSNKKSGCCYVATCVYGSYDCPQVWTLRRYRDDTLAKTWYGRAFVRIYYAISPTFVKWFGKTKWFQTICKFQLDHIIKSLNRRGVANTPYQDKEW